MYDIAGKASRRSAARPGMKSGKMKQGREVQARFFVFDRQPNMDRLVPPNPETPLPPDPTVNDARRAVDRVYWYALGRAPSSGAPDGGSGAARSGTGRGKVSADGLADLLWAVMMTPEFQLIDRRNDRGGTNESRTKS